MRKLILLFLVLLLILPSSLAVKKGHITLLAVKATDQGYEGSSADMYLEIREGDGRVFLDTFPLTKLDTQMSARFAKEVACNYISVDCSGYDFIFIITANSTIIGGPSAGLPAAVLTISLLKNIPIRDDVAATGTINSGGVVGSVGGIKAKIDAAKSANAKKILIPKGETSNETDFKVYAKNLSIELIETGSLNDAFYEYSGIQIKSFAKDFDIDENYKKTMGYLAKTLCDRSDNLSTTALDKFLKTPDIKLANITKEANNLKEKGLKAYENQEFYPSASYCFGANIKYTYIITSYMDLDAKEILKEINRIKKEIDGFDKEISEKGYKTITDLESYMVVKERLKEAKIYLESSFTSINNTEESLYDLAYATERLNSAYSWYVFSDNRGKKFNLNKEAVRTSCINKISEAEERYEYVNFYLPSYLEETRKEIDYAYDDLENEDYELCLFKASKAKADADVILTVIGSEDEQLKDLLDEKLIIVKNIIAEQTTKGIFPIVGYSYYEYANSLKNESVVDALVYSEYALELSNLDMYFKTKRIRIPVYELAFIGVFLSGIVIGFLAAKKTIREKTAAGEKIREKTIAKGKKAKKRKNK